MSAALRRAQRRAFECGISDGRRHHLDGWANHSPSYRAGQAMARVEHEIATLAQKDTQNDPA